MAAGVLHAMLGPHGTVSLAESCINSTARAARQYAVLSKSIVSSISILILAEKCNHLREEPLENHPVVVGLLADGRVVRVRLGGVLHHLIGDLLVGEGLEAVDPAVADAVAELLFLPVQDVLLSETKQRPLFSSEQPKVKKQGMMSLTRNRCSYLWQVRLLLIVERLPHYPLLHAPLFRVVLQFTKKKHH
jgi:hypothetical protein